MQYSLGRRSGPDPRAHLFGMFAPTTQVHHLPPVWSYAYDERPTPYNQGPYEDCVSNAFCRLHEFDLRKRRGIVVEMSRRAHFSKTKEAYEPADVADDGLFLSHGALTIETYGFVAEAIWPYPSMDREDADALTEPVPDAYWDPTFRAQRHAMVDTSSVESIKLALFECGISAVGVQVPSKWMSDVGPDGLLPCDPTDTDVGGHCTLFDGWDDKKFGGAFSMPNSWGAWGDNGVGWMPYSALGSPWWPTEAYTIVAPARAGGSWTDPRLAAVPRTDGPISVTGRRPTPSETHV